MNNEIKEILVFIKDYIDGCSDSKFDCRFEYDDIKLLLDYITNLQQDTEMYAQLKDEYEEEIKELQQENERLQENNSNMQEEMARVWEKNEELKKNQRYYKNGVFSLEYDKETLSDMVDDYKSRCEKAIEYLDKVETLAMLDGKIIFSINIFRNILQNGSDKE